MNKFESYFNEAVRLIVNGDEILFSGYFRGYLENTKSIAVFVKASRLKGYFLALTDNDLYVVETRASATNTPLMECNNSYIIPLDKVEVLAVIPEGISIKTGEESEINLEVFASNKYLSGQLKLIEHLLSVSGENRPIEEIVKASNYRIYRDKITMYGLFLVPVILIFFMVLNE